jgi:hypothetical protein
MPAPSRKKSADTAGSQAVVLRHGQRTVAIGKPKLFSVSGNSISGSCSNETEVVDRL